MEYDVSNDDKFNERRIGLDHLSFEVDDRDELASWVTHLDAKGVDHSGINDTDFGPVVAFRDPDNIQLEFFVHPRVDQVTELLSDENSEDARRMLNEAELRGRSQAEANWADAATTSAVSRRAHRRRVSALAGPNEVLVSSTLRDLVIASGLDFEERGTHQLKGVAGEWRLFAVASA
jgi:hypothetical protein